MVRILVRGCRCAMSWCDLDLTCDLAVVALTYKTLVRGCRCATSWCDLDLTLDLAVVTLTYKMLSGLYLRNRKV